MPSEFDKIMNFTYNIHFEQMQSFDEIWLFMYAWNFAESRVTLKTLNLVKKAKNEALLNLAFN